jgi:ribonucleotide reductase alpha subunit
MHRNHRIYGTQRSKSWHTRHRVDHWSTIVQVAVCNLASIALNRFVRSDRTFDFDKLVQVTSVIVRNLNKIIDVNFYPLIEVIHCRILAK